MYWKEIEMLKKLICFMALITFCAFSGCSESSQNENIELEDAPWGITMEDVFETYGVNKDTCLLYTSWTSSGKHCKNCT